MNSMMEMIKTLQQAIDRQAQQAMPAAYDTQAIVRRIEGRTAWVHIDGGVDETPVERTIACSQGDTVQVRVSGGRAWIQGNATNPPTDDTRAIIADATANNAKVAADSAVQSATEAADAAAQAKATANSVHDIAVQAREDAADAAEAAGDAQESANSAAGSATLALNQLGIIENVVGVLDLLSNNGDYQLTTDTTVVPDKWYFIRTGTSPYVYQVVSNPTGDPSAQGWYELTGINQAVQNYVSSHLALDNNGLWLQTDGSTGKLFLSPSGGVAIYNGNDIVAQYGATTTIGNPNGFNVKVDGTEVGFYQGTNKIAYMNGSQLYVTNSLSFGHFIFYERENHHFTLKRIN